MTIAPYRFAPPDRRVTKLIERVRLLDLLDGRFDRRLTFLEAGAGFGKTMLLADALDRNLEDAAGFDIWLGLGPQDDRERELALGLARAVGLETDDEEPTVERLVNTIWKQSPRDVALVLDDVHYLKPGHSGAIFLEALLQKLPANGHLVLASRSAPPFPISRLVASGEVCLVSEAELAFDADERARFRSDHGVSDGSEDWGGWPALLELAANAGVNVAGDFVWEEVVSRRSPARKRALARIAPLDWLDESRVRHVAGSDESLADLVRDLPLVSVTQDGSVRLHALWRPFLEQLDPEWRDAEFAAAIAHLCSDGERAYREAIEMCRVFDRTDQAIDVVRAFVGVFNWSSFGAVEFEAMLVLLPSDLADSPAAALLDGLLRLQTEPASSLAPLLKARAGFHEASEASLELATLSALGLLAFFGSQIEALKQFQALTAEIDHPMQPLASLMGRATLEILEARPDDALETCARASASGEDLFGLDHSAAAIAALDSGRSDVALERVRAGLTRPTQLSRPSLRSSEADALWFEGRIDETALAVLDGSLSSDNTGHRHNTTVFHAVLAFQNAILGRRRAAREHRDAAERLFNASLGPRAGDALASARAACAAMDGDESAAGRIFEDAFEANGTDGRAHRHTLRALGLIFVLSSRLRRDVEQWKVGPCFRRAIEAARAVVALREEGDLKPAGRLDWSEPSRIRIFLTPRMTLELAAAAVAEGCTDAEPLLRDLAEQDREGLRALPDVLKPSRSADARRFGAVVKEVLARVPARPVEVTTIAVLGPLELRRDGVVRLDAGLRRSRVRDLLHFLVSHRRAGRAEVRTALWPDKDDTTAANNLRVNLSHLLRVLEPSRQNNEPSYFFDLEGDSISLRVGAGLQIDAEIFEVEIGDARACDRSGRIAEALDLYLRARDRYRGDYLADASEPRWGEIDRTRLRSQYLAASIRAASLLLGKGDADSVLELTRDVLAIDDLQTEAYRLQALAYFRREDRRAAHEVLHAGIRQLEDAGLEPDADLLRLRRRAQR